VKHKHEQTCGELLASLSDYADGSLEESLCRELEQHLAACDDCRVVLNTLKKTVELYRTKANSEMPAGVRERLFRRLSLEELMGPPSE